MGIKSFDIILVYSFGRENLFFLSIIKHLSRQYKIGLLLSDDDDFYLRPENKTFSKLRQTEKLMRDLCVKLGAQKVYVNEKTETKLILMYPGEFYTEDYLLKFNQNISWARFICLFFHGRAARNLNGIMKFKPHRYLMPASYIVKAIIEREGQYGQIKNLDIVECGLPYRKYPVLEDQGLDIDYLVALPSKSLLKESDSIKMAKFLRNTIKILQGVNKSDRVVLKHHNVRDNMRYHAPLPFPMFFFRFWSSIFYFLGRLSFVKQLKNTMFKFSSKFAHNYLELRYESLEKMTEYHNLGIELFLPYVRKGVITGLSGVTFHSLFNELNVYNCDPQPVTPDFSPLYKLTLVPFNAGKLEFDRKHLDLIPTEVREADLMDLILNEMALTENNWRKIE